MTRPAQGIPGGAQAALTTAEAAVDLSALRGYTVLLWSDVDFWFTFDADGSGTLVTAGASAASLTSLKARRMRAGQKAARVILNTYPYVIAKTVTGTGTLHVELISDDGADFGTEDATAPALGTVTVSDGAGPLTTELSDGTTSPVAVKAASTAAVAADKALVVAISPNKGVPAFTDNATYFNSLTMATDQTGADITVGPEGRVTGYFTWPATSSPIGRIVFQLRAPDGTTYDEVPGSAGAFINQPVAGAAGTSYALFEGLTPGAVVRFKYFRTSGGAATSLTGQTRVA